MASITFKQQGLTLLELCITGSIVSVLTCLAVPSFQNGIRIRQLESVANELWHDLQYVRATAISLNQNIQFQIQPHSTSINCYVIHTGRAGDCTCAANPVRTECISGSKALKTVALPINRILLTSTRTKMSWSSDRGTVSPASTIRISNSDGYSIDHVINIHGRIRTCSSDGRLKGIPRC